MKGKYKTYLLFLGIMVVLCFVISVSYAYYMFGISQSGYNAISGDCFKITFEDENPISLSDTIPLSDEEAMENIPYHFSVTNVCNYDMTYFINLETLDGSTMDPNGIRYIINNEKSKLLGYAQKNDESMFVNNNTVTSNILKLGTLIANATTSFDLRLFIGKDSTFEQTANKSFMSRVVVSATAQPVEMTKLVSGPEFNSILKKELGGGIIGDLDTNFNKELKYMPVLEKVINYEELTYDEVMVFKEYLESRYNYEVYSTYEETLENIPIEYDNARDFYISKKNIGLLHSGVDNYNIYSTVDNVTKIEVLDSDTDVPSYVLANGLVVSTPDSSELVYLLGYLEEPDVIYIYSKSNIIFLNEDSSFMFSGLSNLESVDLSKFNSMYTTDMSYMFSSIFDVEEVKNTDLRYLDTSNVTSMEGMFSGSVAYAKLIDQLDTSNVENMSGMFAHIGLDQINFKYLNTSSAKYMDYMFANTGNVGSSYVMDGLDTSNVVSMSGMFEGSYYENMKIENFDTSNVKDMSYMFYQSRINLEFDESFDTSNVENMSYMFASMPQVSVYYLQSFDTSNVTNMTKMFWHTDVYRIKVSDKWNTLSVTNSDDMFDSRYWVGGNGTSFDYNHTDAEYARIDDPENGKPGYLTEFLGYESSAI